MAFQYMSVLTLAVVCLILIGIVMIIMRQNSTCNVEGFVRNRYNNHRVGKRARHIIKSWDNAAHDTGDLHDTMNRFDIKISPDDDYENYCKTRSALGGCATGRNDCKDQCPSGQG